MKGRTYIRESAEAAPQAVPRTNGIEAWVKVKEESGAIAAHLLSQKFRVST